MTASLPAGAHASGERLSAQLGLTERVLAGPRMRKLLRVVEDGLDRVEQTLARELKVTDTLADATTRYLYEAGGKRVRPTLVHGRSARPSEQVLSPDAAKTAMALMRQVVTRGTARSS